MVLTAVAGALARYLRRTGHDTEGLELKAMVPVSVRADVERGALGNKVAAMWAPLPVYEDDPIERFKLVHEAMKGLKESGQAVGAEVLTSARRVSRPPRSWPRPRACSRASGSSTWWSPTSRGPQFELFLLGRPMTDAFPMVPLAKNQGLGIAIMSYHGALNFGLVADYDILPDVDALAGDLADAVEELATAAGVAPSGGSKTNGKAPARRVPEPEPTRS